MILIEQGTIQEQDADCRVCVSHGGQRFSKDGSFKKLSSGELIHCDWLIYSKESLSLVCVSCAFFLAKITTESNICNSKSGFKDWKNLNRICDNEKIIFHHDDFFKWKCFLMYI